MDYIPTKKEVEIMAHALGLNSEKVSFRNHFVTGPGTTDFPICENLKKQGLMRKDKMAFLSDPIYHVTEKGKKIIKGIS